jgi:hypothetical protein
MKKEMSLEEKLKFKKQYEELADHQITQMLAEDREAYVEGAYELLQEEAQRRGLEIEEKQAVKDFPEEPVEKIPLQPLAEPEVDVNAYVQMAIVNDESDRRTIASVLDKTDIAYFFQNLHIYPQVELPVGLMVDQPRVGEVMELLKHFKPSASILLW